jgi:hypothetical protein
MKMKGFWHANEPHFRNTPTSKSAVNLSVYRPPQTLFPPANGNPEKQSNIP